MKIYFYLLLLILFSCKKETENFQKKDNNINKEVSIIKSDTTQKVNSNIELKNDTFIVPIAQKDTALVKNKEIYIKFQDTSFVKLDDMNNEFIYDIKYATTDNFLKQKVYDCPECYLRLKTARAIIKANEEFMRMGYRIKVFDCYRPHDVQIKMWNILPGTHYVANPKRGSIHNRGGAIDVTLVDINGNELDMGTPFDFFGKEAHHTYTKHSQNVKRNRDILKNTLKKYGFKSIYSEWWHYETIGAKKEKISNFKWNCE